MHRYILLASLSVLVCLPLEAQRIGSRELTLPISFQRERGYLGGDSTNLGDLDGDGFDDLGVTIPRSSAVRFQAGEVIILFPAADGSIRRYRRLDALRGGIGDASSEGAQFGHSIDNLGDLDSDGNPEIVVGAPLDDDPDAGPGQLLGAVWILFLDDQQAVKRRVKIAKGLRGFDGDLDFHDMFGYSVAAIGDVDGNGVGDLAVGAIDDDGPDNASFSVSGAVWILFLDEDLNVIRWQRINQVEGAAPGVEQLPLERGVLFGETIEALGDIDGDGIPDIAVGSPRDRGTAVGTCVDSAANCYKRGVVYILRLDRQGRFVGADRITEDGVSGFAAALVDSSHFGRKLEVLHPAVDGRTTLAVCVAEPDDQGAIWFLDIDWGQYPQFVVGQYKIGSLYGGFETELRYRDQFGAGICFVRDVNADGVEDLFVAAQAHDDGGDGYGTMWRLLRADDHRILGQRKISALTGDFDDAPLSDGDAFGSSLATHEQSGLLVVGAPGHDGQMSDSGAIYLVDASHPSAALRIAPGEAGFSAALGAGDAFGSALGFIGQNSLYVGAPGDRTDPHGGALWRLDLDPELVSTSRLQVQLGSPPFGFVGASSGLGTALASVEPADPPQLVVGLPGWNAIAVLTQASADLWSSTASIAPDALGDLDRFGAALVSIGDLGPIARNGFVVGAPGSDGGSGAVWIAALEAGGAVSQWRRIDVSELRRGQPKANAHGVGRALLWTDGRLLVGSDQGIDQVELASDGRVLLSMPLSWESPRAASFAILGGSLFAGDPLDFSDGPGRGAVWSADFGSAWPASPRSGTWIGAPTPNPFVDTTRVRFRLAQTGSIRIEVFDAAGRRVRTLRAGALAAGDHLLSWDGTDEDGDAVSAGVYLIRGRGTGQADQVLKVVRLD